MDETIKLNEKGSYSVLYTKDNYKRAIEFLKNNKNIPMAMIIGEGIRKYYTKKSGEIITYDHERRISLISPINPEIKSKLEVIAK